MAFQYQIVRCLDNVWRKRSCFNYGYLQSFRCASSLQDKLLSGPNRHTKGDVAVNRDDLGQDATLSFNDPKDVFKHKTTWELVRALCILKICSYDVVVDNSEKLMRLGQRLLGTRMFSALMNPTFYRQFSGGNSPCELIGCGEKLRKAGIGALLAVVIEEDVDECKGTDDQCDQNLQVTLDCIKMASDVQTTFPMMQIRMTALFPARLCANLSAICPEPSQKPDLVKAAALAMTSGTCADIFDLSEQDQAHLKRGLARLKIIGELAAEKNVIAMVDAESTCVTPAINLLSLAMMLNYNTKSAVIFYTYQNYLKATGERLRRDIAFIDECGVCFGVKLVRGAYMAKERKLAKEQDYPDPIHDTFDDTSNMYHDSMELLLSRISRHPDKTRIIIASHNHKTVELALKRLRWYGIDLSSGSVFLGQLYGLSDHISFLLGNYGYPVYKSIPYGSLVDTLPYLSRRAQENRAILQGVRQERELLSAAVRARFLVT